MPPRGVIDQVKVQPTVKLKPSHVMRLLHRTLVLFELELVSAWNVHVTCDRLVFDEAVQSFEIQFEKLSILHQLVAHVPEFLHQQGGAFRQEYHPTVEFDRRGQEAALRRG